MQNTFRAYIPKVDQQIQLMQQRTAAQLAAAAPICKVALQPSLVYRRVYAWIWSTGATWSLDYDLVGTLNGVEKYRQKLASFTTAAVFTKWYSSIAQANATAGNVNEQLFTFINGTQFGVAPWRHNLAVDTMYLQVNAINDNGGASLFDAGLIVLSQMGI